MPVELDELERRRIQLEIEREALRKERDDASKARLAALEKELADIGERANALKSQWEQEKAKIAELRSTKKQLEDLQLDIDKAERAADYGQGRRAQVRQAARTSEAALRRRRRRSPRPARAGCSRKRSTRTTSPASSPRGRASR